MKIGILTLHSQLNYGGVLQAFASQEALRRLGHDVSVIDRWLNPDNTPFRNYVSRGIRSLPFLVNYLFSDDLGGSYKRIKGTRNFLHQYLHLTPYSFFNWNELPPEKLDFDLIFVGSDQVWNPYFNDRFAYFLKDVPREVPAVAYAASFGVHKIPEEKAVDFRTGIQRFSAITVREREGKQLVEQLGGHAEHVCDPVLLLSKNDWCEKLGVREQKTSRRLLCYILGEDLSSILPDLFAFARKEKCFVDIFVAHLGAPFSFSARKLFPYLPEFTAMRKKIRLRLSADPVEFLRSIASADYVLTDSFHALMFSAIFGRNIRILFPKNPIRSGMFSRLEEWQERFIDGNLFCQDAREALRELTRSKISYKQREIEAFVADSQKTLSQLLQYGRK